jgi:hypothetical protein
MSQVLRGMIMTVMNSGGKFKIVDPPAQPSPKRNVSATAAIVETMAKCFRRGDVAFVLLQSTEVPYIRATRKTVRSRASR